MAKRDTKERGISTSPPRTPSPHVRGASCLPPARMRRGSSCSSTEIAPSARLPPLGGGRAAPHPGRRGDSGDRGRLGRRHSVQVQPPSVGRARAGQRTDRVSFAAIGALAGAIAGKLGGTYLTFFLPFLDIGIAQHPMFGDAEPDGWVRFPLRLRQDARRRLTLRETSTPGASWSSRPAGSLP